jgi:hypothetical protein
MAELTNTKTSEKASGQRVLVGLVILAAVYVAALAWQLRDAVVDDAFIGLVYLRNLLEGHGFVFHPGSPPVEGITNIGWILALAPAAAFVGPVAAAKLMGAVLLFLGLLFTGYVGRELGRRFEALPHADTLMLAPPLLLAASFEFLFFPLAGMETALLACLLLTMVAVALHKPSSMALPVLGAFAFTVHPEAVLVFPIYLALQRIPLPPRREREARASALAGEGEPSLVTDPHPPVASATSPSLSRSAGEGLFYLSRLRERSRGHQPERVRVGALLIYAALLALITLARWAEFGAFLPNTFAAKPAAMSTAFGGLLELFAGNHPGIGFPIAGLLGLGLVLLGWLRLRHLSAQSAAMLGAIVSSGLLFALYARPDWTLCARYFAPYLPAALLLFWVGALDLSNRLWPARIVPLAAFGAVLLCVQGLTLGAHLGAMAVYPGYVMTSEALISPAKAIATLVPEHDTIASRRIGALAYISGRQVFDYVYGLTDAEVARAVANHGKVFEQPTDPKLATIWRARAPRWILEDEPVLADIARKAGGTLEGFTLNGFTYRAVERFLIAPEIAWVLARRTEDNSRPTPY